MIVTQYHSGVMLT